MVDENVIVLRNFEITSYRLNFAHDLQLSKTLLKNAKFNNNRHINRLTQWLSSRCVFDINKLIQINHQPHATIFQFIIPTFIYSSTCFGRFPAHHQESNDCSSSLWFYLRIVVTVVLCSWSGRLVCFVFSISCA